MCHDARALIPILEHRLPERALVVPRRELMGKLDVVGVVRFGDYFEVLDFFSLAALARFSALTTMS